VRTREYDFKSFIIKKRIVSELTLHVLQLSCCYTQKGKRFHYARCERGEIYGAYSEIKKGDINEDAMAHFGGGARIWGPIGL
jgi:hypothetical protein